MTLSQFTEPSLLIPRLFSESHDQAIAELGDRLEGARRIENARAFTHAVLNHDSLVTAVFDEAAFPLARGPMVKELSFAIGLSQPGIVWGSGNKPTVHVIVLFAVPLSAEATYLSLLMTFSNFLKNKTVFSKLRQCAQPEEMFNLLSQVHCERPS